jgi:hypothetical protein
MAGLMSECVSAETGHALSELAKTIIRPLTRRLSEGELKDLVRPFTEDELNKIRTGGIWQSCQYTPAVVKIAINSSDGPQQISTTFHI